MSDTVLKICYGQPNKSLTCVRFDLDFTPFKKNLILKKMKISGECITNYFIVAGQKLS